MELGARPKDDAVVVVEKQGLGSFRKERLGECLFFASPLFALLSLVVKTASLLRNFIGRAYHE